MMFATLYRTRIWLKYQWCEITNWLAYVPAYDTERDSELRAERRGLSALVSELDIHFFNIYSQEEAHQKRKNLVKNLKWKH